MAIKIGTISISLTAETASFQGGMEKASQIALNSSRNIERSFTLMGTAIAAAMTSAVASLGYLISKTEETVFSMQKMAQQAGVSMESFSRMAYAAKTAGMPVDQMAVILTRVSHSAFEAASGSKQAAEAYKAFGVEVQDSNGHFKTADQIMLELAKKADTFRDSAGKTGAETMVMGRSGAQAAEFMKILATRFDEISEKASKLGVVFNDQTAVQAQQLHESFVNLEEAAFGFSVRLLSQVTPALNSVMQRILDFASDADNMRKVDDIGRQIAHGVEAAADGVKFLIDHFDELKTVIEALVVLRLGGMFGGMVLSATEATGIVGKLAIASGNLGGKLLGLGRMGTVLAPMASSASNYAVALGGLAKSEGVAATGALAMSDALAAARVAWAAFVDTVPIAAAVALTFYEIATAIRNIADTFDLAKESGKSFWEVQSEQAKEAHSSITNYWGALKHNLGFTDEVYNADMRKRLGLPDEIAKAPKAPGLPNEKGVDPLTGATHNHKKDFPALSGAVQVDKLSQRLKELHDRAMAAQEALKYVGVSVDMQRQIEIAKKYALFLDEAATAKRKLTLAEKEQAYADISTEVKAAAAEKYQQALYDTSEELRRNTQEHLALADAVTHSAEAMQNAAINAKVEQSMQKAYGAGWRDNLDALMDAADQAIQLREEMNAANKDQDARAASGLKLQVEAQQRLNDAILEGVDARRAAALANAQAAIRDDFRLRGDTDQGALADQLNAAAKKSQLEKEAADLQRADSFDIRGRYEDEVQAINDATAAAERHNKAIDYTQVLAADKEAWLQFQEAQDKAILATGGMMDGLKVAMNQMARDTESVAQSMYNAFNQFVGTMNDALAKVATEHHQRGSHDIRNEFSGVFRGFGDSLMKTSLQKAESGVMKHLGLGKPDGTRSNPWYVQLANAANFSGKGGVNELTSLFNKATSSAATGAGSGLGSVLGATAKLILPMFANGTDSAIPGMPSIVGEKGPEVFIPPASGAIVPNSKLRNGFGHQITNHIDARGSNDPAQTVALINQALEKAAPQIVAHSVKAVHESHARIPAIRRG